MVGAYQFGIDKLSFLEGNEWSAQLILHAGLQDAGMLTPSSPVEGE